MEARPISRWQEQKVVMRDHFSKRLVFIMFVAAMNTFSLGFDLGWWSILIAIPHFGFVFGKEDILLGGVLPWKALDTRQLSLGAAAPNFGALLGGPLAAILARRLGRRAVLWTCSIVTIIATIVEITCSVNGNRYWQLVGGKGVVGIASGLGSVIVPLYLSETAPAPIRGAMVNTLVVNQWLGTFVSVAVGYGVRLEFSSRAWLLPIGLQFVIPSLLIVLTFFIPESPRWLLERGRREEALAALSILGVKAKSWSPETHLIAIEKDIQHARNRPRRSWKDCFVGINLRRTLISVGVLAFSAGSGLGFIANYAVLILQAFTDKYLETYVGILGALVISVCVGFVTQDLFGRRILLLVGAAIALACMLAYAIISTVRPGELTGAPGIIGVTAISLWLLNFTQTWSAVPFTVFAEIPADDLREKVIAMSVFMYQSVNIIIVYVSPYIQDAQGGTFQGKIGYLYAAVSLASFIFTYFCIPDLAGRQLIEIDEMFEKGVPIRRMHRYKRDRVTELSSLPDESLMELEDTKTTPAQHLENV